VKEVSWEKNDYRKQEKEMILKDWIDRF
jgi:hypothetical protein